MRKFILLLTLFANLFAILYADSHKDTRSRELIEAADSESVKAEYWNSVRKGANYFNDVPSEEWLKEAQKYNIVLVRMAYDKWEGGQRDFLLGDSDNYQGIVQSDLKYLIEQLDLANQYGIKVILVPLSLPGARWTQNNDSKPDGKLWRDFKYHEEALMFWKDLALALKDHPAVIAYNIINEPFPEKFYDKQTHWTGDFITWYEGVKNTAGDLNLFYTKIIEGIRSVDKDTSIILDTGLHATPWAIEYLEKQEFDNILYSFHMYEPYEFTTQRINNGQFSYSDEVLITDTGEYHFMNKEYLEGFLSKVNEWSKKNDIPSNRIIVGEFGVSRETLGAELYMADLIDIFNENSWHWLFYSFQEDTWHAWDYQFGSEKINYKYWEHIENNTLEENRQFFYDKVSSTPVWDILKSELSN